MDLDSQTDTNVHDCQELAGGGDDGPGRVFCRRGAGVSITSTCGHTRKKSCEGMNIMAIAYGPSPEVASRHRYNALNFQREPLSIGHMQSPAPVGASALLFLKHFSGTNPTPANTQPPVPRPSGSAHRTPPKKQSSPQNKTSPKLKSPGIAIPAASPTATPNPNRSAPPRARPGATHFLSIPYERIRNGTRSWASTLTRSNAAKPASVRNMAIRPAGLFRTW